MKVLLVNGSPHEKGCTYTALREVADTLNSEGIETEFYTIGTEATSPCRHCCACRKLGRCVIKDRVNDFVDYAAGFDGYVIGSPVHYGAMCGVAVPFLDRAFYVSFMSGRNIFRLKPAAAIVSARRAGTTATFDQLNKYFLISQMTVIGWRYWNMVHGMTPEDVRKDEEGMQTMRILGRNMAYQLKCLEAARKAGVQPPAWEPDVLTNFIH